MTAIYCCTIHAKEQIQQTDKQTVSNLIVPYKRKYIASVLMI